MRHKKLECFFDRTQVKKQVPKNRYLQRRNVDESKHSPACLSELLLISKREKFTARLGTEQFRCLEMSFFLQMQRKNRCENITSLKLIESESRLNISSFECTTGNRLQFRFILFEVFLHHFFFLTFFSHFRPSNVSSIPFFVRRTLVDQALLCWATTLSIMIHLAILITDCYCMLLCFPRWRTSLHSGHVIMIYSALMKNACTTTTTTSNIISDVFSMRTEKILLVIVLEWNEIRHKMQVKMMK